MSLDHLAKTKEFGNFQTPARLAGQCCPLLNRRGVRPKSLIEPTCGLGSFLVAALGKFPGLEHALGVEINVGYVETTRELLHNTKTSVSWQVIAGDFSRVDWKKII